VSARSFWPPVEAAQVDYETLRAQVLEPCGAPQGLAAARFAARVGRVDRLAQRRAGVCRRVGGRGSSGLDAA
jgi:hypothetical protein